MKVALYARVSTDKQTNANQKLALKEHAKRLGCDYEYFEDQLSTRQTRPVKNKLLNRLRKNEFDRLVIWRLDRWARTTTELLLDIDELERKGVKFVSLTENIDLTTAAGRMMTGMLAVLAQFERDRLRERIMLGLSRAKKEGKKLGRPKGSKDSKRRRKSGYLLRWSNAKP